MKFFNITVKNISKEEMVKTFEELFLLLLLLICITHSLCEAKILKSFSDMTPCEGIFIYEVKCKCARVCPRQRFTGFNVSFYKIWLYLLIGIYIHIFIFYHLLLHLSAHTLVKDFRIDKTIRVR